MGITSQKQYLAAKEKLKILKDGLKSVAKTSLPNVMKKAAKGQIAELAQEIEAEIKKFKKKA